MRIDPENLASVIKVQMVGETVGPFDGNITEILELPGSKIRTNTRALLVGLVF